MLCEGRRKLGIRVRRAKAMRSSKRERGRHADLLTAIDHPRRRRILRMLHERSEPANPIEIALKVEGPLGLIAYHVRVLRELGAVERVGEEQELDSDSAEHFYESRIGGDPSIEAMLEEDEEEEDEEEGKEES